MLKDVKRRRRRWGIGRENGAVFFFFPLSFPSLTFLSSFLSFFLSFFLNVNTSLGEFKWSMNKSLGMKSVKERKWHPLCGTGFFSGFLRDTFRRVKSNPVGIQADGASAIRHSVIPFVRDGWRDSCGILRVDETNPAAPWLDAGIDSRVGIKGE